MPLKKYTKIKFLATISLILAAALLFAQDYPPTGWQEGQNGGRQVSLKSAYGKFYAYIVLLFNENPHFVNLIEKDSIPLSRMSIEGFHIREYKNYLATLQNTPQFELGKLLLSVYLEPDRYAPQKLEQIEKQLDTKHIILKFSHDVNGSMSRITLDYCIFGRKDLLQVSHPFFKINERIYNIQPYIYYDEFSTSNSTFYFDMIYINPVEVNNDYLIAKKILHSEKIDFLFFVGSPVTDDIRYCLLRAFNDTKDIRSEIWEMFVIHELTHKIFNNRYNNFDQVTGEILSLHSTIFSNSLLGLAVLYSYLNYNKINPHRIAAMKFIIYIAEKTGKKELVDDPGMIKLLPESEIKNLAKEHFNTIIKNHRIIDEQP